MKRLHALLVVLMTGLIIPPSLMADNVLVFGTYSSGSRANLTAALESLGHTVTNQADLPADLTVFNSIWQIEAFLPLSADYQTRLAAYLSAGGGLHLTGERPCCEALNDSLQQFVNLVVTAGGVQVGDLGDIGGPYTINPSAVGGLATTPNAVSVWVPSASGGMGGIGTLPAANILATGAGDIPVGAAWDSADLVGGTGRLTLLMDVNWFDQLAQGDNTNIVENIQTFLSGNIAPPVDVNARFNVTKTFSDGITDEVDVTLTCNGGLPLVQNFTIAGGDLAGVTFVVNDIPDTGVTCTVTESGGPDGYTPDMNNGAGCSWNNVTGGLYVCQITNEADPGEFTVTKNWVIDLENGDAVNQDVEVTIWCDAEISPYTDEDDGDWYYTTTLGDGDSATVSVDTTTGTASCWAVEDLGESASSVEAETDCQPQDVSAGEEVSCTFTNTVFFEGIPTLSQYGLAILVLLTLGVGLVGFRRFA